MVATASSQNVKSFNPILILPSSFARDKRKATRYQLRSFNGNGRPCLADISTLSAAKVPVSVHFARRIGIAFTTSSPLYKNFNIGNSLPYWTGLILLSSSFECEESSKEGTVLDVWLGRLAMVGFASAISVEIGTGKGILKKFCFINTAGIRKRADVTSSGSTTEALSVNRAFFAIRHSDFVALVVEAMACITEQDFKIAEQIEREGNGCLIVVNK